MKEDIKILEELLQGAKDNGMYDNNKYFYSIENLIKGYRELKEINESFIWQSNFDMKFYEENYIPKSKIKEKIEELKETADEDNQDDYIKIQVLKELAEAFEKHIPNIE